MDARASWSTSGELDAEIADRWSALGPYYAMFPIEFARNVIRKYTAPGDFVLDPFCGRGTAIFCAGESARNGLGIEINPVGWLYAKVKLRPASCDAVESRLVEIAGRSRDNEYVRGLPEFFRRCYCPRVLEFLVAARSKLNWRTNQTDATLMALILVNLHGRIDDNGRAQSLSNQMRQTKAMSQEYSINWWRSNGYRTPPKVDPVQFLRDRLAWRYAKGRPKILGSEIKLGDAEKVLRRLPASMNRKFSLLLTSPPYSAVTSYYFDQWLRLWMLGDMAVPSRRGAVWKGRFENREVYKSLIENVFCESARFVAKDGVVYVRTDARSFTFDVTREALKLAFPNKKLKARRRPFFKSTQTALFGDAENKPGEVDLILQ